MKLKLFKLLVTGNVLNYVFAQSKFSKTYYWGQNSVSYLNPSDSSKWEQRLSYYCDFDWVDNIALSFINNFPLNLGMNHAYHCWTTFPGTNILNCPIIGSDIQYCQTKGKKIGISLGGAYGSYGFQNNTQANNFAYTLWNLFFEGQSSTRPYGDVILDFVDFNIESGNSIGYYELSKTLRYLMDAGQKSYFLTTSPQCVYPDNVIGPGNGYLLSNNDTNFIDNVFIQFYNNYCGLDNYPNSFNYNLWNSWVQTKNSSLSIGFPTHTVAAGSGFVDASNLSTILQETYQKYPNSFTGIMGWDIGFANINDYGKNVYTILQNMDGSTPTPTSTQTNCPTATETVTLSPTITSTVTTTSIQTLTGTTTITSTTTTTISTSSTVTSTTTRTTITTIRRISTVLQTTTRFVGPTITSTITLTPTTCSSTATSTSIPPSP